MTPHPLGSRYLLEEPLGQGGMGVVWRGRDRQTGAPCAIKVLPPEFAADPAAVARFVRERTALIRFRHPNVVTLHDMIVEGEFLALVMDLIDGGDLNAYRRDCGGTLSPGEALGLTAQICDALAAAHAAGIVHRDLKPANVLLDAGQVRLADFGIARIAGESPVTTTGSVIGTIGFMAPEVINGEMPTAACDMYAVGITLYELLAGVQPFTGHAGAVIHGHLQTMPAQPARVPDRLWTLISACLSKDPAARPPAAVLARALRDPAILREAMLHGQAAPFANGPYDVPPRGLDPASQTSTYVRRPGPAHAPRSGLVTQTAGPRAEARNGGVLPAASAAFPGAGDPLSSAAASQPTQPGRRAGQPGPRRPRTRVLLVATAAVALAAVGVTYMVMPSSATGKSAGQLSPQQIGAAGQSTVPALTGSARHVPRHRPSRLPGVHATASAAAQGGTGAGPVGTPSAPASSAAAASQTTPATTAGTPGPPVPTGPNLVADGDFTQSGLSAWNDKSGTFNSAVVSSGRNGGYAVQMSGQPNAGVAQIVTGLKPGTEYQLTAWIYSGTGGYHTYVGAKAYSSTAGVSRAVNPANTWLEVSMTFAPGPGHTTAEVFCWQAVTGTGYCSDVSLRALS